MMMSRSIDRALRSALSMTTLHAPALPLMVLLLMSSVALSTAAHAAPRIAPRETSDARDAARNPLAPVYLVMSRATYGHVRGLVASASAKTDGLGTPLVLAQTRMGQLSRISERIHKDQRHCAGYFAFDTRAQAEAFLRADRSASVRKSLPTPVDEYHINNAATVDAWLPQVQAANIRATIAQMANFQNRYYTSATGRSAAEWLQTTWQGLAAGRSDVSTELFACASCATQPSVILTIRGNEIPNDVVVLGAHLDSINGSAAGNTAQRAPGADDDASGIATLTETLRIALANGWRPKRTVKFMGYAAEEVGLRGSNAIAQAYRAAHVNVVAAFQLDMTNYKTGSGVDMRLVTDYSNSRLQTFLATLFDTYLAPKGFTRGTDTCDYACSDHASWTAAGYPAGYFFEAGAPDGAYFPYIHTASDTLANMADSADNSAKYAMISLAFLAETAKTSEIGHAPVSK